MSFTGCGDQMVEKGIAKALANGQFERKVAGNAQPFHLNKSGHLAKEASSILLDVKKTTSDRLWGVRNLISTQEESSVVGGGVADSRSPFFSAYSLRKEMKLSRRVSPTGPNTSTRLVECQSLENFLFIHLYYSLESLY